MEVDRAALRKASAAAPDIQDTIKAGVRPIASDTSDAAAALGAGWATSDALEQVSSAWQQALNRFAESVGDYGPKLAGSADNYQWAEDKSEQAVNQVPQRK